MKFFSKARTAHWRKVESVKGYLMLRATKLLLMILHILKKKIPEMKVSEKEICINLLLVCANMSLLATTNEFEAHLNAQVSIFGLA